MRAISTPVALLVCALLAPVADAQQPPASAPTPAAQPTPARELPRPEELEPAVDTSRAPPPAAPTQRAEPSPTPAGAEAASPGKVQPAAPAVAKGARGGAAPSASGARKGPDRLQLDTTDITGNRELPKVLYIVPWKRSDLGDLAGRPVNSLLDEVLQPLDRDVFRRENRYYDALKPGESAPKADLSGGSGEKP
jgi:hypothetical protein